MKNKFSQKIFLMESSPSLDHCRECSGEEFEGGCGKLNEYLVVNLKNDIVEDYAEETVCDGCANAIMERPLW